MTTLARFLTQRDHFSRQNQRVKERAFLPNPQLELSMYQIDDLDENAIWGLCIRKPCFGRGDLDSDIPIKNGLKVAPDSDRHVNILGWPPEKHAQKSIAQELAKQAKLQLMPEP